MALNISSLNAAPLPTSLSGCSNLCVDIISNTHIYLASNETSTPSHLICNNNHTAQRAIALCISVRCGLTELTAVAERKSIICTESPSTLNGEDFVRAGTAEEAKPTDETVINTCNNATQGGGQQTVQETATQRSSSISKEEVAGAIIGAVGVCLAISGSVMACIKLKHHWHERRGTRPTHYAAEVMRSSSSETLLDFEQGRYPPIAKPNEVHSRLVYGR